MFANPTIEQKLINGIDCILFTFKGKFTENDAVNAITVWRNQLAKKDNKHNLVWNCLDMTGYEPMARSYWQRAIKELKNKINKIWLISDSSMIITGANILSIFTSMDIRAIKSENDIS